MARCMAESIEAMEEQYAAAAAASAAAYNLAIAKYQQAAEAQRAGVAAMARANNLQARVHQVRDKLTKLREDYTMAFPPHSQRREMVMGTSAPGQEKKKTKINK